VRRAMPLADPLSLSNEDVYAVSAYVLFLNSLIGEDSPLDEQTLPQVQMPDRKGFVDMSGQ
jgi:cytochrome c